MGWKEAEWRTSPSRDSWGLTVAHPTPLHFVLCSPFSANPQKMTWRNCYSPMSPWGGKAFLLVKILEVSGLEIETLEALKGGRGSEWNMWGCLRCGVGGSRAVDPVRGWGWARDGPVYPYPEPKLRHSHSAWGRHWLSLLCMLMWEQLVWPQGHGGRGTSVPGELTGFMMYLPQARGLEFKASWTWGPGSEQTVAGT